jgi:hypothetical protein
VALQVVQYGSALKLVVVDHPGKALVGGLGLDPRGPETEPVEIEVEMSQLVGA